MLLIAAIVLIGIAGWGFHAARREAGRALRPELQRASQSSLLVDRFIWSEAAPRTLRRRFVLTQACGVAACACLTAVFWSNHGGAPALALGAVTLAGAGYYAWRMVHHGL